MKVLFETKDLSLVKKYVERQFTKIMEDRVSIQDFTFAKEYRGMKNYRPGACVPALSIARYLPPVYLSYLISLIIVIFIIVLLISSFFVIHFLSFVALVLKLQLNG